MESKTSRGSCRAAWWRAALLLRAAALTLLAAPLAKKRARRAAGDGTRCTLEVPAARPTEDDVRV